MDVDEIKAFCFGMLAAVSLASAGFLLADVWQQIMSPWYNAGFEAGRASMYRDCHDPAHSYRCEMPS